MQGYARTRPDVRVTYMPFGTSRGVEMVAAGGADFGDSDAPRPSDRSLLHKVLFFPVALGAIVPIYNLEGPSKPLRFTPQALAGIYLGRITRWDDAALAAANPGVALPSSDIVVIHTASGRGSTYIWSEYLSKVSTEWRTRVGRGMSPNWPVGKEVEGNGNVAKAVHATPNSIGYVELAYAVQAGLPHGVVQNAAGKYPPTDENSVAAAASAAMKNQPDDLLYSLTDAPGAASYPISSFTWFVIPASPASPQKQQAVKDFLRWILNEGQRSLSGSGLIRVPEELAQLELNRLDGIP
jgi:phosphate transport system substrate-binding protein